MDALIDLFTSLSGLMSLGVVAFVCVMGVYFTRMALRKMEQEEAQLLKRRTAH